jgi:hypothetical protein
MLRCSVGYMDVTEESRAMLGCSVKHVDVIEGSRAIPWVPGKVH